MAFLKGIRRLKSCTLRPKKMAAVCHQKAAASPERKPKEDLPSSSKIVHGGLLKKGKGCGFAFAKLPASKATHGTRRTSLDLLLPDSEPPRSRGAVVLYLTASPRESPYRLLHLEQQITGAQDVSLLLLRPSVARQAQHLLPIELVGHRNLHLHLHRFQHAKRSAFLQDVARLHSV